MKFSHSIAVSNSIVGFNSQNKSLDGSPAPFPVNRLRTAHLPPKFVYKIHISFRARPRTLAGGSRIAAFLLMAVSIHRERSRSPFSTPRFLSFECWKTPFTTRQTEALQPGRLSFRLKIRHRRNLFSQCGAVFSGKHPHFSMPIAACDPRRVRIENRLSNVHIRHIACSGVNWD